jgi:exodeoxyribonuclease-3
MVIYSWNVNGFQTCDRYGGLSQIVGEQPDFICLQEVKVGNPILLNGLYTYSYEQYYNFSSKKGHNGVFVYSRYAALNCFDCIGFQRFDSDGRFICLEFDTYYLINVYMPHGGRDKCDLDYKMESYSHLMEYLGKLDKDKGKIVVGDFNIAQCKMDVERYKNNFNNIMFTQQERDKFLELMSLGYVDAYRRINPHDRRYSWWPYAYNARENNVGWRIDYCLTSEDIFDRVREVEILKDILGSDHCPIRVELDMD